MKRMLVLRIAFLSFFLAGLSTADFQGQLMAQSGISDNIYDEPQGNFVSPIVASERIDNSVTALKIQMEFLNPNSPEFKAASSKYAYFIFIQDAINNGKTVPQAIVEGLHKISAPDAYNVTKNKLVLYKQEAVDLLKA